MLKKNKIICIIPAKLNSQRIKKKNIINLNGFSLLEYTLKAVKNSKFIDNCFVSSESNYIKSICNQYNIRFIKRPLSLTKKRSTSESAIIHALKIILQEKKYDTCIFLQPTSPLRFTDDIDNSIKKFFNQKLDSLFSSSIFKGHIWKNNKINLLPINYDFKNRKMDQDKRNQFIENGSIYIFNINGFLKQTNRLFGKIGTYVMDDERSFQVDEIHDINIVDSILKKSSNKKKFVKP